MLGADLEARKEDQHGGRKLTMRQHYKNTIQKEMEHTGVLVESWHSEWRDVARNKENWKKCPKKR